MSQSQSQSYIYDPYQQGYVPQEGTYPQQPQVQQQPSQQPAQPGVQPLAPPPPLGKTPTNIKQIMYQSGKKGTHFTGPVVSGLATEAMGTDMAALTLWVDYTMTPFSLPIQFPLDAVLVWVVTCSIVAFSAGVAGDALMTVGTTNNGTDIVASIQPGAQYVQKITQVVRSLPLKGIDPVPGQAYFSFNNNNNNTGGWCLVSFLYTRCAMPWG
jgi:hypothetical protein